MLLGVDGGTVADAAGGLLVVGSSEVVGVVRRVVGAVVVGGTDGREVVDVVSESGTIW